MSSEGEKRVRPPFERGLCVDVSTRLNATLCMSEQVMRLQVGCRKKQKKTHFKDT